MPSKISNTKLIIGAGVVVVVLLLVGAIISRQQSQQGPRVMAKALEELAAAETLQTRAELHLNLPERLRGRERPFTKVTTVLAGGVDLRGEGPPIFNGTVEGEARGRGNSFFFNGDLAIFPEEVLFRLEEFPVLLNPSGSLVERWTGVTKSLLTTTNEAVVEEALASWAATLQNEGVDEVAGRRARHLSGQLTDEQRSALATALGARSSGNQALNVLARLLRVNEVRRLEVWVDTSNDELIKLEANFVRPLDSGEVFDFATLTLSFTDYNSVVAIERPEAELTVRPEVFARLFGTGDVETLQQ